MVAVTVRSGKGRISPGGLARGAAGDEVKVISSAGQQAVDDGTGRQRVGAGAEADYRRSCAVAGAQPILEIGGGRNSVRIDRAIQSGVARGNAAGRFSDHARREKLDDRGRRGGGSRKGGIGASGRAGRAGGNEVEMIGRAWQQAADGRIDRERACAGAEVHYRCSGAVSGAGPILETGGGGSSVGINRAYEGGVAGRNPDGASTTACFEYGTSATYGATTPVMNLGAGTSALAVNSPVGGLLPGTTYHFHLVAASAAGTAAGTDATFATPAAAPAPVIQLFPPSVITKPASGIASSHATLNGSVDPNGVSTTAYFEYGLSTSYSAATPIISLGAGTNSMAASALINGLLPRTTYHFHLVASNAAGKTAGADAAFTTPNRHGNH